MLTVLCLNAGIDRTYEINDFAVGGYFRPQRARVNAGGKGINVARVAHRLGVETIVSGFAGGAGGSFISRQLNAEGVLTDFVPIEEEPRVCVNVINRTAQKQTQIDEVGPLVTPSELTRLRSKWRELLAKSAAAVLSGSAPRGVPFNVYAELITIARRAGVPAILDAREEYLAEGVKALPHMVKPNLDELSALLDRPIHDSTAALAGAQELAERGIGIVLVSLGAKGVVGATRKQGHWIATPPKVDVVSAVGSGDALVAGFTAASLGGRGFEECLRWGVAAGAANAATFGNAFCTREQVMELAPHVKISQIDQVGTADAAQPS